MMSEGQPTVDVSRIGIWSGISKVAQGAGQPDKRVQRCKTEKAIHLWADLSSPAGTPADRRKLVKNASLPPGLQAQRAKPLARRMSFFTGRSVSLGLGWTETFADSVVEDGSPAASPGENFPGISSLPDRCIVTIMSFISNAQEWVTYKLVCKRWARLANEALRALQIADLKPLHGKPFVEALHQFGNLASLQLHISRPGVVCDALLGCIALGCPQVKSLHIAYREDENGFEEDSSPRQVVLPENSASVLRQSPRFASEIARSMSDSHRDIEGSEGLASSDVASRGLVPSLSARFPRTRQAVTEAGFNLLFAKCWQLQNLTIAALSPPSWTTSKAPANLVVPSSIENLSDLTALALHLPGCTSLPSSLGDLENLVELSLSCENLKALPESIGNLQSLCTLDLSGCHSLIGLPDSLGDLYNLKTLLLKDCHALKELPSSIGKLSSLKTLNCQGCQTLVALPDEIVQLDGLETLDLEGCLSLSSLPKKIGRLTSLSSLDTENCPSLTSVPESVEYLVHLSAPQMCALLGLASHPFVGVVAIR